MKEVNILKKLLEEYRNINNFNDEVQILLEFIEMGDNSFEEELKRVLVHGILHYCGYKDKSESDEKLMRQKEDEKIKMFHVKH